jgi:hypothetical protein
LHYNGSSYGVPGRFEKLNTADGSIEWAKTVTKSGERISLSGCVDNSGNIYFGPSWSGYTLWKYNSDLTSQQWSWTGSSGFEYVMDMRTDAAGNLYASGYNGSASGDGSTVVKLNSAGGLVWQKRSLFTSAKDEYCSALAVDSAGNVYRGGADNSSMPDSRGRLLGHAALDGSVFLNVSLSQSNSEVFGLAIDAAGNVYDAYTYNRRSSYDVRTGSERTVVEKRDASGNLLWSYLFDNVGMYLAQDALLMRDDSSVCLAFNQNQNGHVYPGVAEISTDGQVLWERLIDRPDWATGQAFAASGDLFYVGLSSMTNSTGAEVVAFTPEPATLSLLALGGLALLRRRKR